MQQISSIQNERLKATRRLRRSKGRPARRDAGRLLLEGPHLIDAALTHGVALEFAVVAAEATTTFADLLNRIQSANVPISAAPQDWVDEAADADTPRGLLAVGRVEEKGLGTPDVNLSSCRSVLLLDRLQDPGNVGAVIRSGVASGCDAILATSGTASWRHPRALRASAGASLAAHLVWGLEPGSDAWQRAVHEELPRDWIGLSAHGGFDAWRRPWPERSVLVVGSEAHGLQPELLELVTEERTIPLQGGVESLNAAVAAALMLFARSRGAPLT